MVFDSLKKMLKLTNKKEEEIEKKRLSHINEEIDEYEKEIQEYLRYSSQAKQNTSPPAPYMPETLSEGKGISSAERKDEQES